jgi:hypothetical protein
MTTGKQGYQEKLFRLLNSKRFSVIELNNHKNSPQYMELFSETNEIFKEIELKCKK